MRVTTVVAIIALLQVSGVVHSAAVQARAPLQSDEGPRWTFCRENDPENGYTYTGVFKLEKGDADFKVMVDQFRRRFPEGDRIYINCPSFDNEAAAVDLRQSNYQQMAGYGEPMHEIDWGPDFTAKQSSDQAAGPLKTLRLPFRPADGYDVEGYTQASIDLHYKFMICAGEVQVAYALDRKSLRVSDSYMIKDKDGLRKIAAPPAVAPLTVELDASVTLESPDYVVARFKDAIAGEALGMGCFTGQTKTLGKARTFIPANLAATPAGVRSYLNRLNLRQAFDVLPTVLNTTSSAGALADAAARDEEAERLAAAERERLTKLNEEAAARTKAQTDAIAASKAKYESDMAAYRSESAEFEAAKRRYAADMQAHDAAVADYQRQRAAYEAQMKAAGKTPVSAPGQGE